MMQSSSTTSSMHETAPGANHVDETTAAVPTSDVVVRIRDDTLNEQVLTSSNADDRVAHPPRDNERGTALTEDNGANAEGDAALQDESVVHLDLSVRAASPRQLLAYHVPTLLLTILSGVMILVSVVLPTWRGFLVETSSNSSTFAETFNYSEPGLREYQRYAPCTLFKRTVCERPSVLSQCVARWKNNSVAVMSPIFARLMATGVNFVPTLCEYNVTDGLGERADVYVRTDTTHYLGAGAQNFSVSCDSDTVLNPMVNVTEALILPADYPGAFPDGNNTAGTVAYSSAALLEKSSYANVSYYPAISNCTEALRECAGLGYAYVWNNDDVSATGYGLVHRCEGLNQAVESSSGADGRVLVHFCANTVYEPLSYNATATPHIFTTATTTLNFFSQVNGIRFVGPFPLMASAYTPSGILYITTLGLVCIAVLTIVGLGYSIPVQRFQLRSLRIAVEIDANLLVETMCAPVPQTSQVPSDTRAAGSAQSQSVEPTQMNTGDGSIEYPYGRGHYIQDQTPDTQDSRIGDQQGAQTVESSVPVPTNSVFSQVSQRAPSTEAVAGENSAMGRNVGSSDQPESLTVYSSQRTRQDTPQLSATAQSASMYSIARTDSRQRVRFEETPPQELKKTSEGTLASVIGRTSSLAISDMVRLNRPRTSMPTIEEIARAARQTMLHARAKQLILVYILVYAQLTACAITLILYLVGFLLLLFGASNPAGQPCEAANYIYCYYSWYTRDQPIVFFALAFLSIIAAIILIIFVLKKHIW